MNRARTRAEAVLAAQDGPRLVLAEAVELVAMGGAVARAVGIDVVHTDRVPRGTYLEDRTDGGQLRRLVVGTRQADPLEAVRRDTRRQVRAAMRHVTPWHVQTANRRQEEAEELVDQLVGAPPAWPA